MSRFLVAALLAMFLAGCSSADSSRNARLRLSAGSVAAAAKEGPIEVRLNPAACDCPEFEMRVNGRWIRIRIVDVNLPDQTPETWVAAWKGDPATRGTARKVWLTLDSKTPGFCANGTAYFGVRVQPDPE